MTYNSDNFDLTNWNLTIPVDSSGGITGTALIIHSLTGYESKYFYDAPDGGMVFYAPVDGATTSGSHYARSELRELTDSGSSAAWHLSQGGTMTATLKVDAVPTLFDGTQGKEVIGQIHGANDELCRLYWDKGTIDFHNDLSGSDNTEHVYQLKDAAGNIPNISLGETFSYEIDARGTTLTVKVWADNDVYTSVTSINSVWSSDSLYFKAGVYLGVNETQGTGGGQDTFYGFDMSHTAGQGLGGLTAISPTPAPAPSPSPAPAPAPSPSPSPTPTDSYTTQPDETLTVTGTSGSDKLNANSKTGTVVYGLAGNDAINGHDGNDALLGGDGIDKVHGYWGNDWIHGGTGNDTLWGDNGDDVIIGGAGSDTVSGGAGHDTFVVNHGDNGMYITDFIAGSSTSSDKLVLEGYSATDLATATLTQSGTDAVLHFANGDTVTFHNVKTTALTSGNLMVDTGGTLTGFFDTGAISPSPSPSPVPAPAPSPTPSPTPTETMPATTVTVNGTSGGDSLNADHDKDTVVYGLGGNDSISGHDGNDVLLGGDGSDVIHGYWGNDWIDGGAGTDTLYGDNGLDRLMGGTGADKLYGGVEADTFVFKAADLGTGVDTIGDFSLSQGDRIDISDVLHGHYDPASNALTDFVQITTSGSNSVLNVDLDGAGSAYGWQQVATITGVTSLTDEQVLVNSHNLIVS